jgi:hypothetical protein
MRSTSRPAIVRRFVLFRHRGISTGEWVQLITPLDADGQTAHARAVAPKERIIDLRVGNYLRLLAKVYRVL